MFMIDVMDKACYQHGHGTHFRGFNLATSTFVLSILDVDLYSYIPQALRFITFFFINFSNIYKRKQEHLFVKFVQMFYTFNFQYFKLDW